MADTPAEPAPRSATEPGFVALSEVVLILGLQLVLLFFRLGQIPLLGPDEPRYARVAVEMARSNEFVTPTLAGEAWLEKPPLYYWLAGFGFRLFGENEFAARLPAALAALLTTAFTGLFAARLFGRTCGRLAMLILATSPLLFAYGRAATMDALVAAFMTGASGLLILSILGISGPLSVPAAWALMGVAVLAKGPIGLLIPAGVAVATALATSGPTLSRIVSPLSIGVFALVAGPWFVAIYAEQGFHFVEVFILNHNLQRFTTTTHNHPGPFYYYLPVLFLAVFPWSGLLATALPVLRRLGGAAVAAICAWLLVPLIFFSLAGSKLPGYIVPCLPPLAIALALSGGELAEKAGGYRRSFRAAGLIGLVVSAAIAALVIRGIRDAQPWARSALLPSLWAIAVTLVASRAFERARSQALRVLTIGAAGFLVLLTLVAPPVLDAMESGRRLFLPAGGREVLVVGAWRTAWMSGYFYNNGRVKELTGLPAAEELVRAAPRLVLFGPSEWRRVSRSADFALLKLAEGPRGTILARMSLPSDSRDFARP